MNLLIAVLAVMLLYDATYNAPPMQSIVISKFGGQRLVDQLKTTEEIVGENMYPRYRQTRHRKKYGT